MNPAIYIKMDKMYFQGYEMYYRKPINTELHPAMEILKNYEYYYKENEEQELKFLGKFIECRMYRSSSYFDEYDYPIIVFEKDNVFENKKKFIYCKGIPDIDENKILIEDMLFEGLPIYYQK
jgi:hypothetical protein